MAEHPDVRVLLVCGSTRPGSTNLLALQAVQMIRRPGLVTEMYGGLRGLPAFVPDEEPVPASVADLWARTAAADAVLFSTPEYAGGLPGSLKNFLDWTVGAGVLYGKPTAWIDVANPGRGAGARDQLRSVLGYVGADVVTDACVHVDVDRTAGAAALSVDAAGRLERAVTVLCDAVRPRSSC